MNEIDARQYIIEHRDTRPRRLLCEETGKGLTFVYRTLRECGAEKEPFSKRIAKWKIEYIRKHFADEKSEEIAKKLGIPLFRVKKWARRMKLFKSEAFMKKLHDEQMARWHTAEVRAQCARKWKLHRRMAELRLLGGQPVTGKWHFPRMKKGANGAKWSLRNYYGYLADADDPNVLYYTDGQKRTKKEKHFTERYGLQFIHINDDEL